MERAVPTMNDSTKESADKSLGQIAYEAYLKFSDYKSLVTGHALPHWEALDPRIQMAWMEASGAVVRDFIEHASKSLQDEMDVLRQQSNVELASS